MKVFYLFLLVMSLNVKADVKVFSTNNLPLLTTIIASQDIVLKAGSTQFSPGNLPFEDKNSSKCYLEYAASKDDRYIERGTELKVVTFRNSIYATAYETDSGIALVCQGMLYRSLRLLRNDFKENFSIKLPEFSYGESVKDVPWCEEDRKDERCKKL